MICAVRTRRIISGLGSGGGAGDAAEKVSGGITTLYTGFETVGAGSVGEAFFAGGTTGCASFACAGMLNSMGGGLFAVASADGAGGSATTGGAVSPASGRR